MTSQEPAGDTDPSIADQWAMLHRRRNYAMLLLTLSALAVGFAVFGIFMGAPDGGFLVGALGFAVYSFRLVRDVLRDARLLADEVAFGRGGGRAEESRASE